MSFLLAPVVSVILLIVILRFMPKNAYPKGFVPGLLAWGGWCALVVGVTFAIWEYYPLIRSVGLSQFWAMFLEEDSTEFQNALDAAAGNMGTVTLSYGFADSFLTAAIPEETAKFLVSIFYIKRLKSKKLMLDCVVISSIAGLGFQIVEDFLFATDGLSTVIIRGLVPFHFTFGAVMGYYIGRALCTEEKKYMFLALILPIMLHGMFDFSISMLDASDWYLLLCFIMYVDLMKLTALMLVYIKRKAAEESSLQYQ